MADEKKYIIRAALHDETNNGWIWMDDNEIPSRAIVKITSGENNRNTYCVVRKIDSNFHRRYNHQPRIDITDKTLKTTLVMAEWYRDALGGFKTTKSDNKTGKVKLSVTPVSNCFLSKPWYSLRAASHHPDLNVRLGTRLGVMGGLLGYVGLMISIVSLTGGVDALNENLYSSKTIARLIIAPSPFLLAYFSCRGPKRPKP